MPFQRLSFPNEVRGAVGPDIHKPRGREGRLAALGQGEEAFSSLRPSGLEPQARQLNGQGRGLEGTPM